MVDRMHIGTIFGGKKFYYWVCTCGDRLEGTVPTMAEAMMKLRNHINYIPECSGGIMDEALANLNIQGVLWEEVLNDPT